MNHTTKSALFVAVAVVLSGLAVGAHYATRPREISDFARVGTEFYPDFQDPTAARTLEVSAVDPGTGNLRKFSVAYKDGLWRIPSHHDYPAEAAERLASTATSLRGLVRESLIARRAAQHEQYGVLDPLETQAGDPESIGRRITLRDGAGKVLADYIIGKPAPTAEPDELEDLAGVESDSQAFYVRTPQEQETYVAHVDIDLSTRFSDWIEPDLLKLEAGHLRRIEIDHQRLEDQSTETPVGLVVQIVPVAGETDRLAREDEFAPWTLEGLNPETEELDTLKVGDLVRLLDDMTIVGVRPKYQYEGQPLLTADLELNEIPELLANPQLMRQVIQEVQADLDEKGFVIATTEDQQRLLILSRRGQLAAGTDTGVVYTLHFGDAVVGDESEIEIGGTRSADKAPADGAAASDGKAATEATDAAAPGSVQSDANAPASESDATEKDAAGKNRYVMIRVTFDPELLGPEPSKPPEPTAPEPPPGYDEWKKAQEEKAAPGDAAPTGDQTPPADDQPPQPSGDEPPQPPAEITQAQVQIFKDYEAQLAEYQAAQATYTMELAQYEAALQDRQRRSDEGQKLVKELNERFADWYYVISADALETLKLDRSQLVRPKQAGGDPALEGMPSDSDSPPRPNIEFPEPDDEADEPPPVALPEPLQPADDGKLQPADDEKKSD
jgi:hypothetical protein